MKKVAIVFGVIVLILAGVFTYFLSENSWDVTMTRHVIQYEIEELMGKGKDKAIDLKDKINDEVDDKAEAVATGEDQAENKAEQTEDGEEITDSQTIHINPDAHTKDSLYKDGNTFSDIKKSNGSEKYTPKSDINKSRQ